MTTTEAMKANGIERIVFVPASDLIPHDVFHAWTFEAIWSEQVGRGATIEEAIADAVARREHREAA